MIWPLKLMSAHAFISIVALVGSESMCVQLNPIASPPHSNSVICTSTNIESCDQEYESINFIEWV